MKYSMKKYTSLVKFGVVIGMITLTSVLFACGDKAPTKDSTVQLENKTLKVAVGGNMPPFTFIDGKGSPIGFDVDVITHIATKNGYEVTFNILPWQDLFSSVERGDSDVALSAISYSVEREGKYLLSNPYVYMPAGILSLEQTGVTSVADLKPLRLGMMTDSIFQEFATAHGINQIVFKEQSFLNFKDLVRGDVDAIISDKQVVAHLANNYPDYKFNILEYGDINDKGSYAVALSSKNQTALIQMFNAGITDMKASGELARLEKKWFDNSNNAQTQ